MTVTEVADGTMEADGISSLIQRPHNWSVSSIRFNNQESEHGGNPDGSNATRHA